MDAKMGQGAERYGHGCLQLFFLERTLQQNDDQLAEYDR